MRRTNDADTAKLPGQMTAAAGFLNQTTNCKCVTRKQNAEGDWSKQIGCGSKLEHAIRVASQAAGFDKAAVSGGRGSDTPNPVAAAVMALELRIGDKHAGWKSHHGPEWWHDRVQRDTALIAAALADLVALTGDLGKVTDTTPRDLTRNGQGLCRVCDTFCSGAHNDRLKAELCPKHYQQWQRAGRPERIDFIRARRGELAS